MAFANFICTVGDNDVLLDIAESVVLPAFLIDSNIRQFGDTSYYFYQTKLVNIGKEESGTPIVAIAGHFVKDTILKREQIFDGTNGLVEDVQSLASAPSAFFILILNNHRLLYFAETSFAPTLDTFRSTAQIFIKKAWEKEVRRRHEETRNTVVLSLKEIRLSFPPPIVTIIPVAQDDKIEQSIDRFKLIKSIRLKLIKPNDETNASAAIEAVERTFRPLAPGRLEIIASDGNGLSKEGAIEVVRDASISQNTEIIVSGEDYEGLKMKADNDELALIVSVDNPPSSDGKLTEKLVSIFDRLSTQEKVRRPTTPDKMIDNIRRIVGFIR